MYTIIVNPTLILCKRRFLISCFLIVFFSTTIFGQRVTSIDNKGTKQIAGNLVTESAIAPIAPPPIQGDVWEDTTTNITKIWDGDSWESVQASRALTLIDTDGNTQVQVEETPNDDIIRFDTNGIEQMVITQGRVGIRESNPSEVLDVTGSGIFKTVTPTVILRSLSGSGLVQQFLRFDTHHVYRGGGITWSITGDSNTRSFFGQPYLKSYLTYGHTTTGGPLTRHDDPAVLFKIRNSDGFVALGSHVPSQKLDVDGSIRVREAFYDTSNDPGTSGQVLSSTATGTNWIDSASASASSTLIDTDGDTQVQVEESADEDIIRFDTAGVERAVITATGNVGIGTNSPAYSLDVVNDFRVATASLSNNTPVESRVNGGTSFSLPSDYTLGDAIIYVTFTTGSDVTTTQTIYETGGSSLGTDFLITGGQFRVYAGNTSTIYNTTSVLANTSYSAAVVYDLTNDEIRLYLRQEYNAAIEPSDLINSITFTQNDWSGTDFTGVGAVTGTSRAGISGNFLGTGLSQIDLYATNDITTISGILTSDNFIVDVNGNVGIGTTTPTQKLEVTGNARITGAIFDSGNSAGTSGQILSSTATGTDWITAPSGADGDAWGVGGEDETSAVARVGAVGVGSNTAPTETLDVTGTFRNTNGGRFVVQGGQNGGIGRGIYMWSNNNPNWGIYMGQSGATRSLAGDSAPAGAGFTSYALRFRANNNATTGFIFENNAGTLLSSIRGTDGLSYFRGNVGIGSTSPSQKLHVVGNARITGAIFDSGNSAGTAGQVLSSTVTGTEWVETGATATPISETEYNAIAASNTIVGSTDAKLAAVNSGAYTQNFGTLNPAATHQVKNAQSVFAIKFRSLNPNTSGRFVAALTDTSTGIVEYVSVPLLYTTSSGTFPYTYMKLTGFKNTTGVAKSLSLYNITAGMATTTNSSTNYGIGTGEIGDDLNAFTFSEVPYQFVTNYVPYEKIVIWAEESAGLGSNQLEWSFGDGASGNIGIPLPEDWEAYAVSFNADNNGAADTIEMAIINSNTNTNLFTFTASGNPNNMVYTEILATPVAIPAGTSIGFRTVTEIGNVTNARVAVFLRRTP